MAKQLGPFFITGTIHGICFYRMDQQYYARSKSSLSGKRVKTDPAFAPTMRYAGLLKEASTLASSVYKKLDSDTRKHTLYRQMTGMAMRLLKEGKHMEEVRKRLAESFTCQHYSTSSSFQM